MKQIIDNKELEIGKKYVYLDNTGKLVFVKHEKGKFQNAEHEKNYLESQGAIYMMVDLDDNNSFDLHRVDYLDYRYKVYPINSENLGFILNLHEFRISKTNQKNLLKHFYGANR